MATFTCERHLAEHARAVGLKVTPAGLKAKHPFRVHLTTTGATAAKEKKALFHQAFRLEACCCCCGRLTAVKKPVPPFAHLTQGLVLG